MFVNVQDGRNLRAYLLGNLSLKQQAAVDAWIMSDEQSDILLTAAEDDLIDASLSGGLTAQELQRFTDNFLQSAERRQRFQFGRSLQRVIQAHAGELGANQPPLRESELRREPAPRWFQVPVFAYATAALVVVLIVGSLWGARRAADLAQRLDAATAQRQETEQRLESTRVARETLRAQIQMFAAALASNSAAPDFELRPGLRRSADEVPEVLVTGNPQILRFALFIQNSGSYSNYNATLIGGDGEAIVELPAAPQGPNLMVSLPAGLLTAGGYSLKVSATGNGATAGLDNYYFSVRRPAIE